MAKGSNKRRKGHFTRGLQRFNQREAVYKTKCSETVWKPRLTRREFQKYCQVDSSGLITGVDSDHIPGNSKFLRPKADVKTKLELYQVGDKIDDNITVNRQKMLDMINFVITEHGFSAKCKRPNFKLQKHIPKGLTGKWILACTQCDFISSTYQLYDEVDKSSQGAKAARVNIGMQVGLQETSTGNTKLRVMLSAANMTPGAKSGLARTANKIGDKTVELNKKDMAARRTELKDILKYRSVSNPKSINVQTDGWYASRSFGSRRKLGQAATLAIAAIREDITDQHQIIELCVHNKLCWRGAWLRNNGLEAECPNHDGECTATYDENKPFSEYEMAYQSGTELALSDLIVRHITTDGDAKASSGMEQAMKDIVDPMLTVERLADRVHVGQAQIRAGVKAQFSRGMFAGDSTTKREDLQNIFAHDIKNRCSIIMSELFKKHNANSRVIGQKLAKIVDCVVNCYNGDCTACRYNTSACDGGLRNSWWNRSTYCQSVHWQAGSLEMDVQDKLFVRSLLEMKLSVSAFHEMRMNTTSNQCESFHSSLSASVAKSTTYFRNARGRSHAVVHRVNNKSGESILAKLEYVGAPVTRGSRAAKTLKQVQDATDYSIEHRKKKRVIARKHCAVTRQMRNYLSAKQQRQTGDYVKGQLDRKPILTRGRQSGKADHSYAVERAEEVGPRPSTSRTNT
jgi:hypothetical protein